MIIENVIKAWNAQADEYNQWDSLDADERVNFTLQKANNEIERLNAIFKSMHWVLKNHGTTDEVVQQVKSVLRTVVG